MGSRKNAYGKKARDLSDAELSRLAEQNVKGLRITAQQYRALNPGRQVNFDNSSGRTKVVDDKTFKVIKPMSPARFKSALADVRATRKSKATIRKPGTKRVSV
jgi:hypothetical protein